MVMKKFILICSLGLVTAPLHAMQHIKNGLTAVALGALYLTSGPAAQSNVNSPCSHLVANLTTELNSQYTEYSGLCQEAGEVYTCQTCRAIKNGYVEKANATYNATIALLDEASCNESYANQAQVFLQTQENKLDDSLPACQPNSAFLTFNVAVPVGVISVGLWGVAYFACKKNCEKESRSISIT